MNHPTSMFQLFGVYCKILRLAVPASSTKTKCVVVPSSSPEGSCSFAVYTWALKASSYHNLGVSLSLSFSPPPLIYTCMYLKCTYIHIDTYCTYTIKLHGAFGQHSLVEVWDACACSTAACLCCSSAVSNQVVLSTGNLPKVCCRAPTWRQPIAKAAHDCKMNSN